MLSLVWQVVERNPDQMLPPKAHLEARDQICHSVLDTPNCVLKSAAEPEELNSGNGQNIRKKVKRPDMTPARRCHASLRCPPFGRSFARREVATS
jgi:hypothetical protein